MKRYTLNSLFEENEEYIPVYDNKGDEILDEGLKELGQKFFNRVKTWARQIVKGGKFFVKQIGKSFFMMFKQGKNYGVLDTGSKKVAAKWTKATKTRNHQAFFINEKVYRGRKNVAAESKFLDKLGAEILIERSPEEIQKMASQGLSGMRGTIGDIEEPEDKDLAPMSDEGAQTGKVDFDELYEIMSEVAYSLKYRNSYKQDVPSMLLMGPPGAGKTSVMKAFARDHGMQLKILEISSLYKEVIGGFPTLEKTLKQGMDPDKLSSEEKGFLRDELYNTTVKITQTDILPPSEDGGKWLLFLDEFNRDEDKMGAAMNLILTGNIGTTYKLPLKTIVVASGNLGRDLDGVDVAKMDTAVWDRFSRKLKLDYDWLGWAKYADYENDEFTDDSGETVKMGPKVAAINAFVLKRTQEEGVDNWTIDLSQFDPDAEGRLTPRTLSKIDRQIKLAAMQDWEEDTLVGSHDKKFYQDKFKKKGFPSPQAYYLHVNQWNEKYIPKIMTDVIGPKSGSVAMDVLQSYQTAKRELTEVSPGDALLNWTTLRKQGTQISKTVRTSFMSMAADLLEQYGTVSKLKNAVEEQEPNEDFLKQVKGNIPMYVAANIANFFVDTKTGPEDIASFITEHLAQTASWKKWNKADDENDKEALQKLKKNNSLVAVTASLLDISKDFQDAWALAMDAKEEEETKKVEESLKQVFGRML